jgi:hypothetical protein
MANGAAVIEAGEETYLGDRLYASFDGWMITLRAPCGHSDHWVGLEPDILSNFVQFIESCGALKRQVSVSRNQAP